MIPQIPRIISKLPYTSDVLIKKEEIEPRNFPIKKEETGPHLVSKEYQGFFDNIAANLQNVVSRGSSGVLLNSNFNILSANMLNPVTPAEGTDFEVIKQWYVSNGTGTNNYIFTPTAFLDINYYGAGSNHYLDVKIINLDAPLYLYNLNYSSTGQFNSISQFSGRPLNFSYVIYNAGDNDEYIQFSVALSGTNFPDGTSEIFSEYFQLTPGFNVAGKNIVIPDLTGISYDPSCFLQVRAYFISANSTGGAHLEVGYLKAELNVDSSHLEINPVVERLICNALT